MSAWAGLVQLLCGFTPIRGPDLMYDSLSIDAVKQCGKDLL
jgi:hypothetical protein